jgi:hypothetical protein
MGGKSSGSGARVANTANRDFGGSGFNDQSVAFFSHDGLLTPKFELTGDPHCLIAAIPKDFDVTFWTHNPRKDFF